MTDISFDVIGIGNAIVDIIARAEDDFLVAEGLAKGSMQLIDEARAEHLYGAMGPAVETSGGSAANTIAGLASFGATTAFVGKVRDDQLGTVFAHDIRALGTHFETPPLSRGPATARSMILVTPDGERTMNTFLGAAQDLAPDDIDAAAIRESRVLYLEGYLWDPPQAKEAFLSASDIALSAGRDVALTLSDSFCVERYRSEFLDLMRSGKVSMVFANEHEARTLYETGDIDTALDALAADTGHAVVTRSENGATVLKGSDRVSVPAAPVDSVVDLTGAGDQFAAGYLFGHARGLGPETSARLGALAAAEVIQHVGPRPQVSLKELAEQSGLSI